MKVFNNTSHKIFFASWVSLNSPEEEANQALTSTSKPKKCPFCQFDVLKPLRQFIDNIQVRDRNFAHRVCRLVPPQCPFERDIKVFGKTIFHIPPLCKLNPLYEEVVSLRFRALCYLADECGEDVTQYC
ncbi:Mo-dependent nitrogenase C-terminal domain-containing protein [Calothrix sp. NIES-3974]|uniref:Mo-dependent nitrogenase C-terminal domain-containing protein n=1 Tax=Calothrix sp. NIES-3974 TaxID=2005462 RepID=UPI000B620219|nr:Mo-dependent nitrogenase C-terminal domain-containing protein [Calothrix sp. NIES-3974]BAZ05068.1 Mo-dependent nitrogenase family protein [Calothrix sp. NIES-3974]